MNKLLTIYKDLHFKSVGRTAVWGQVPTTGFPFLPLEIINPNSKTVITILSISSDKDTRTSKQSANDGTTKSSGEVRMSDFRYHEVTDGTLTSIVYPVNIKYVLSSSISN